MISALRSVWYLVVALVVIVIAGVVAYSRETPRAGGASTAPARPVPGRVAGEAPRARPSEHEKVLKDLKEIKAKFDEDPKGPDAPACLHAMGNLTVQKLQDYKEAARLYELLLIDYGEWEGAAKVYPQLAACYERLNDQESARGVYKRMMDKFAPDSQEYLYAQSQLGL